MNAPNVTAHPISSATAALIDLLVRRDAAPVDRNGIPLDRSDLPPSEWLEQLTGQLVGAAHYAQRLKSLTIEAERGRGPVQLEWTKDRHEVYNATAFGWKFEIAETGVGFEVFVADALSPGQHQPIPTSATLREAQDATHEWIRKQIASFFKR